MDEREREYKRMDKQGWVEKADEEEEDEVEDEDEEEEEKVEETNGAEMEMGMEIAEKGTEKGTDEEMGEAVEGMEVESSIENKIFCFVSFLHLWFKVRGKTYIQSKRKNI